MKKLILILLMSYTTLICGEWSQISDITSGEFSDDDYFLSYIISNNNKIFSSANLSLTDPYVFISINSGENWKVSLSDNPKRNEKGEVVYKPKQMLNFNLLDSIHAIVMCEEFFYWRTEDGGENWVYNKLNFADSQTDLETNNNLAIISNLDSIITTTDFGKSWNIISFNLKHDFDLTKGSVSPYYFKIIDSNTILANCTYFIDFYHKDNKYFHIISTDFGKTWQITEFKNRNSHYKYYNLGNNKIYAVGSVQVKPYSSEYRDLFKISTDGGYSWNLILDTLSTPKQPLDGVEFIDDKNGIAFARDWAKLYRTSDGGMTWWRDNGIDEFQYPPHDYDYLPNGEILAVARTGKVYRWTDPSLSAPERTPKEKEREIKIYPNPATPNQSINITFNPAFRGNALISIIDINGKTLSTYKVTLNKFEKQFEFKPEGDLPAGTYFFQIGYSNGAAERQKFVVE